MTTKDQGQIHFVRVVSSVVANTATVAGYVFNITQPHSGTVNLYTVDPSAIGGDGDSPKRDVPIGSLYTWLTAGIFLIAILCLLSQIALGFVWPEPTAAQAVIMDRVGDGWKICLGGAVGLLVGKSVVP